MKVGAPDARGDAGGGDGGTDCGAGRGGVAAAALGALALRSSRGNTAGLPIQLLEGAAEGAPASDRACAAPSAGSPGISEPRGAASPPRRAARSGHEGAGGLARC